MEVIRVARGQRNLDQTRGQRAHAVSAATPGIGSIYLVAESSSLYIAGKPRYQNSADAGGGSAGNFVTPVAVEASAVEVTLVGKTIAVEMMTNRRQLAAPGKAAHGKDPNRAVNKPAGYDQHRVGRRSHGHTGEGHGSPARIPDEKAQNNGLSRAQRSCINDIAE